MFGPEHFDDPMADPGPYAGASTGDGVLQPGGVWSPMPEPADIMPFTDVALDAAAQARIRQIAVRLEELAVDNGSGQHQREITALFAELAGLSGSSPDEVSPIPSSPDGSGPDGFDADGPAADGRVAP